MEYFCSQLTFACFLEPHSGDIALSSTTAVSKGGGCSERDLPSHSS